ncbi:hypothetical protein OPIT5_27435 [Opitutaceae bacterium TAV5]|nr:hypothetical protein OPIT5_27435 [Opitutaceae bacterium TAV5]
MSAASAKEADEMASALAMSMFLAFIGFFLVP